VTSERGEAAVSRRSPLLSLLTLPGRGLGALARGFRAVVVRGRWFVLALWIAGAALATLNPAPAGGAASSGEIGSLLPADSEAFEVQQRSLRLFQVPVLSDTAVVVRDRGGLSLLTQADVTLFALAHTQAWLDGETPRQRGHIVGAVPVPSQGADTAVTYLYVTPFTSLAQTSALGRQYASHFEDVPGVETYVTGVLPAQVQQGFWLESRLRLFEIATLVLITLVVAVTFRSVVAPLVVLLTAALGYLVAVRLLGNLAAVFGFALPEELRPLIAALLIGVVTDYCVLFFSGFRRQLQLGRGRLDAARHTVLTEGPIVAVAGLTVAGGTAALLAANFELFRAFGPALALTVVVGMLVSLTLVPAVMAILGNRLFLSLAGWRTRAPRDKGPGRTTLWLARAVSYRRGALVALLLSLAVLVPASLPLLGMRIDVSFTSELPSDDPVRLGAEALDEAGVRGAAAPTEVLVEGENVVLQRDELERLQRLIEDEPGVAQVTGPAQNPFDDRYGIVFSRTGDAARYVVVFDSDPLGAPAIADLERLEDRLGGLIEEAGVDGATAAVAGQTAIAGELAELTRENLWITLIAAFVVEFVILMLYLRAVVAPLLLLVCSVLGVAASLGLAVLFFQGILDNPGLIFFAPFTTAVLLLALGSDYNVFAVGSIWDEASRRPLNRAIAVAMPTTARAISAAGVILAATFAMVAIIPLGLFRQIAFTMAVGLLIDTFLIRPVLTPAVLTLLGRTASWPSRRVRTTGERVTAEEQAALIAGADRDEVASAAAARSSGGTPGETPPEEVPPDGGREREPVPAGASP
jgi:putative drug exporter of the RND superfamily